MRILYVCTFYQKAMIFRDAMDHLEERGHHVIAFNAVPKGTPIDDKFKPIMDEKVVHRECFNFYDRLCFPLKQRKIKNAIEKEIDLRDFELIHSHTLFSGGWATYQLHKKYGIPYVVTVRNTDLNVFLKIPVFKHVAVKAINSASGVLFLSEAYRDKLLELCFHERDRSGVIEKSAIIPNGLEPFWIDHIAAPKHQVKKPLALLYAGRIDKNKNIETTVKVLDRLNAGGIAANLTVIGQIMYDSAEALLKSHKNVTVIPFLKKEELIRYYREADIFVMPSYHESFGRVYVEAMTQGVPVIYTQGEGFDKLFPEGTVGYSVKPDSVEEILEASKKIVDNYAEISANCVEKSRLFDWKIISQQLENLYIKAAAHPSGRRS